MNILCMLRNGETLTWVAIKLHIKDISNSFHNPNGKPISNQSSQIKGFPLFNKTGSGKKI